MLTSKVDIAQLDNQEWFGFGSTDAGKSEVDYENKRPVLTA